MRGWIDIIVEALSPWDQCIENATNPDGSITLYHGGRSGIEQLRTDVSSVLVGCYLTPNKRIAKTYGGGGMGHVTKNNGSLYTVRVVGRILNLHGDESSLLKTIRKECHSLARERLETYQESGDARPHREIVAEQTKITAEAHRDVWLKYGYVGYAIPSGAEIIILDPAAMTIIGKT